MHDCLQQLRSSAADVPALTREDRRKLLAALDTRRRLVACQRRIEDWLSEWQRVKAEAR